MQASQKVAAVGASAPIAVRLDLFNRGAGIIVTVPSTATATYTVQVSGDPQGAAPLNWANTDQTNLVAATSSQIGFLTAPMTFIRVNVTAYSGAGNIVLSVVQADAYGSGS